MKKKLLLVLSALLCALTLAFGLTACSELTPSKGLEYTLNDDGTAYIVSGKGSCSDKDIVIGGHYEGLPVTSIGDKAFSHCSELNSIVILDGVTAIGNNAFEECSGLTSVTIRDGVKKIGENAFSGCIELTKVTMGSSVEEISGFSFSYCIKLNGFTIGNSVKLIGERAFWFCYRLENVTIGNSVTAIGKSAFEGCAQLAKVTIGKSVTAIGDNAFGSCDKLVEVYNLSTLDIAKGSVEYGGVGYSALNIFTSSKEKSKLSKTKDGFSFYDYGDTMYLLSYSGEKTEITLPNRYKRKAYKIYRYALSGHTELTGVTINGGVTSIGEGAFYGCDGLSRMIIDNSVNEINKNAFVGCKGLKIYYKGTATEWEQSITGEYYFEKISVYYYSEKQPVVPDYYWHYVKNEVVEW